MVKLYSMMDITAHIKEAYFNLATSKIRSLLAVLGILIGTASVVAMVSSAKIATETALAQFKTLGTDLLAVSVFPGNFDDDDQSNKLTLEYIDTIQSNVPDILTLTPYTTLYLPITQNGIELQGAIIAGTQSLQDILHIKMQSGRFISYLDGHSFYCVIGEEIAAQFPNHEITPPIGQQVRLGDIIFTVVGVIQTWPENTFFNENINKSIIIPIKSASLLTKNIQYNDIIMKTTENAPIDQVQSQIKNQILKHVNNYSFYFRSPKELIKSMESQGRIFNLLLGLIGSISLIVGGIGVMNIMLVSVIERRREIGIRRAVGARKQDIQYLFLSEAVILTVFGGMVGVILGISVSFIISIIAGWLFTFFFLPPFIGFIVSVVVGIFFGFYPALKASRLDPIETLRAE